MPALEINNATPHLNPQTQADANNEANSANKTAPYHGKTVAKSAGKKSMAQGFLSKIGMKLTTARNRLKKVPVSENPTYNKPANTAPPAQEIPAAPVASTAPAQMPAVSTPSAEPAAYSIETRIAQQAAPVSTPAQVAIPAEPADAPETESRLTSPAGTLFSGMSAAPSRAEQLHQYLTAQFLTLIDTDLKNASGNFAASDLSKLGLQEGPALDNEIIRMEHKFKTVFKTAYRAEMRAKSVNECARLTSQDYISVSKSVITEIFDTSKRYLQHLHKLQSDPKTGSDARALLNSASYDYNFHSYVAHMSKNNSAFATAEKFNTFIEQKKFVEFDVENGMSGKNIDRLKQSEPYVVAKESIARQAAAVIDGLKQANFTVEYATVFANEKGTFSALWENAFSREFDAAIDVHAPNFSGDLNAFMHNVTSMTMANVAQQFNVHTDGVDTLDTRFMLMNAKLEDSLTSTLQTTLHALGASPSQPNIAALEAAPSSVKIVEVIDLPIMQTEKVNVPAQPQRMRRENPSAAPLAAVSDMSSKGSPQPVAIPVAAPVQQKPLTAGVSTMSGELSNSLFEKTAQWLEQGRSAPEATPKAPSEAMPAAAELKPVAKVRTVSPEALAARKPVPAIRTSIQQRPEAPRVRSMAPSVAMTMPTSLPTDHVTLRTAMASKSLAATKSPAAPASAPITREEVTVTHEASLPETGETTKKIGRSARSWITSSTQRSLRSLFNKLTGEKSSAFNSKGSGVAYEITPKDAKKAAKNVTLTNNLDVLNKHP